jgi:hypothetical protein
VGSGILVVARISTGDAEQLIANLLPSLVFSEESLLVRSHNRYTEQKRRRRTATPAHTTLAVALSEHDSDCSHSAAISPVLLRYHSIRQQ